MNTQTAIQTPNEHGVVPEVVAKTNWFSDGEEEDLRILVRTWSNYHNKNLYAISVQNKKMDEFLHWSDIPAHQLVSAIKIKAYYVYGSVMKLFVTESSLKWLEDVF